MEIKITNICIRSYKLDWLYFSISKNLIQNIKLPGNLIREIEIFFIFKFILFPCNFLRGYRVLIVKGGFSMELSFSTEDQIDYVLMKYSNMVYRLALSRTKNIADAEDIVQEVFLRLVNKKPHFENEEHRKAWLIRVTLNCSNKLLASAWFKRTVPLEEELKFETREKNDVYYAVMELPLKYRTVIHLYHYEDMSIAQISEALKIKESTIKSQLSRARQLLKIKLKGEFDNEQGYI